VSGSADADLYLRDQISRIDRNQAEIQKLFAEAQMLRAERIKFRCDPWFIVIGALIGSVAILLPSVLRGLGLVP
jgi:hypothetical protein